MLNKKNLIGNPRVIEDLFKKGKIFKSELLIFRYRESDNGPQFAVSVSKKIYKKANKRNRLRRQIQEALRLNLPELDKKIISLVIAKASASEKNSGFRKLCDDIKTFYKSI